MDYETNEENNYDSDFIDEDTESRLYSAVFFETSIYTPVSHNLVSKQIDSNGTSFLRNSELSKSPVFMPFECANDGISDTLTTSPQVKKDCFKDECESDNSSSSSGCSVLLRGGNESSETEISTQGVILGVSHDTLLHVENGNSSPVVPCQTTFNDDPNLWKICNADKYSSRSTNSRYFNSLDNSLCSECGSKRQKFHRCCTCCILCGEEGHEKDECDKMYCYACLAPGHTKHECHLLKSLKKSICERCGQQGHNSTTSIGRPIQLYDFVKSKGCCNCGHKGHTFEDCHHQPLKSHFIGPLPRRRVLVYDKKDIYKSIRLKLTKLREKKTKCKKTLEEVDNCKVIDHENENQLYKHPKSCKQKKQKCKKSDNRTHSLSYNKSCKFMNKKKLQKAMEQELPYKASSSPYMSNLKQKAIKQRMDFAKLDVLPSLEIEETKKKRKVSNENRKLKSQSVLLSRHEFSSSSSYHFNETSDNFSITKRTRKRRKSRSSEDIHKASTSYSPFQNTHQTPLRKWKKKYFSQSVTS
ncbi:hypothetical protein Smp_167800 [Schistosoma mansoni]|uniref:hypothetical protein n=1 Tax=Schistosoma mansoni TaxID=6183 RepID=UPI00022DC9C5|nr:hypothetical protein Smp_167800 [Schistosoma mansoni]|eukprot:XP_018655250.1 hypothetical protein Smp_167800 [Schistosoma mansoni]